MRTITYASVLFVSSIVLGVAQDRPPRIASPEVAADRRVTFRLLAPDAREVLLSGEFMQGTKALERGEKGIWSVTVGPIEPEIYHYNFTIDGVRTIDPANATLKTGATASTLASVLEVRGDRPTFYDAQSVPHGEIRVHWYESKALNSRRSLTVYTPPGYDRETKTQYPVLYLLHGANGDENVWYRLGRANIILDNLLSAGKTRPFLIVMPFGYGVLPDTPSKPGENTTAFSRDLIEDVIPFIQSKYRVLADRNHRAIAGLSMGGGQSLTIGLNHLELFSHVAGFSAAVGNAADFPKTYASLVASKSLGIKRQASAALDWLRDRGQPVDAG